MYFYVFDAFLRDKKYETALNRIESRLFDLGIQGRSEKLTILKSMKEVVEAALKREAKTIVAVGDDQTVSRLIGIIAGHDVVLGIIPLGKYNRIAEFLGVPYGEKACDILSARIVERLDLGKANDSYFLSFLDISPSQGLSLECDGGEYRIEPMSGHHSISIYNFGSMGHNPRDGVLEAVIRKEPDTRGLGLLLKKPKREMSVIPVRTARIKSLGHSLPAYADGQTVVKTPVAVSVAPRQLRVIVGKHRQFP